MKSILLDDFVALFRQLPDPVKAQARRSYRLWKENRQHPSLHFKRAHTKDPVYSVRISRGYRALGLLEGETIAWFWVGSHTDYDETLTRL